MQNFRQGATQILVTTDSPGTRPYDVAYVNAHTPHCKDTHHTNTHMHDKRTITQYKYIRAHTLEWEDKHWTLITSPHRYRWLSTMICHTTTITTSTGQVNTVIYLSCLLSFIRSFNINCFISQVRKVCAKGGSHQFGGSRSNAGLAGDRNVLRYWDFRTPISSNFKMQMKLKQNENKSGNESKRKPNRIFCYFWFKIQRY